MKISYNWLKQYTNFDLNPTELAEVLTDTGLEVEGIEEYESIKGALEGICVGEVLECIPHPDADRLSITKVDVGSGEILPIVCGAPNVAQGQKVAVATTGTTLYSDDDSFTIKKTKIRGEVSQGMICAEDELGIGTDHDGILILDPSAIPGQALSKIFQVEKDTILEIGLTPNRIDGACHIGTARDIVAFLNLDQQKTTLIKPDVSSFAVDNQKLDIKVRVENNEACIRYSGVSISDIEVKESPEWLKNRLKAIGLNPINNIVDITNFVLHETGQPLHAFDADKITGNEVIIKTLSAATPFLTLDEEERKLSDQDLMICDSKEGMCIAGVFGGHKSGVSENTKSVFLESACFDPVYVRKTAKRHGLNTDSSFRFERGTDPNGTIYALKRAALLIKELAGGQIASEIQDDYPVEVKPYPVFLKWSNLDRLIGIKIPRETVIQILELLDIHIAQNSSEGLKLEVATYRVDVKREADVIEEILRIYGYNNIGISEHVNSTLSYAPTPDPELLENRIAEQLVAQGFNEMMA
ncbi:MAG: phenylalanine--tRNA ligase subunit beta, partial [Bacteroidales bacterium]|nr:phenylalanine--tRNA ligase subunit beta [Bacteroidales bacterium]